MGKTKAWREGPGCSCWNHLRIAWLGEQRGIYPGFGCGWMFISLCFSLPWLPPYIPLPLFWICVSMLLPGCMSAIRCIRCHPTLIISLSSGSDFSLNLLWLACFLFSSLSHHIHIKTCIQYKWQARSGETVREDKKSRGTAKHKSAWKLYNTQLLLNWNTWYSNSL